MQTPWMEEELRHKNLQAWMKQNYFGVVAEIVSSSCDGRGSGEIAASSSGSRDSSTKRSATANVGDMFGSPSKKARQAVVIDSNAVAVLKDVHDLHTMEISQSDAVAVQVLLLNCPTACRYVKVPNKSGAGGKESVAVLSVLFTDRYGPMALEVWRECAEALLIQLTQWKKETHGNVYVQLEFFEVRTENRPHQGAIRTMHSTDRTKVTQIAEPTCESLADSSIVPSQGLYTKDFNRLSMKPPYIMNIAGIINMVQDETRSNQGNCMRLFRLTDSGGTWIQCRAFGRHTDNIYIKNGQEVVLYFVSARKGLNNSAGQLWIYDKAHIAALQTDCAIPNPREQMGICDD